MSEDLLRNKIREMVNKAISENKEITREGVVSSILNHISGVLKKSRDKRLAATLDSIRNSGPAGKRIVDKTLKYAKELDDSWDEIQAMADAELN